MSETRKVKAYYKDRASESVPAIILQEKWREQYGFSTSTFISVECKEGKLVINPREPEPGEEIRSIEERVSTPSKSQRKKLSAVLDDIEGLSQ